MGLRWVLNHEEVSVVLRYEQPEQVKENIKLYLTKPGHLSSREIELIDKVVGFIRRKSRLDVLVVNTAFHVLKMYLFQIYFKSIMIYLFLELKKIQELDTST